MSALPYLRAYYSLAHLALPVLVVHHHSGNQGLSSHGQHLSLHTDPYYVSRVKNIYLNQGSLVSYIRYLRSSALAQYINGVSTESFLITSHRVSAPEA